MGKVPLWWGILLVGAGFACEGVGGYLGNLYFLLNYAVNLK